MKLIFGSTCIFIAFFSVNKYVFSSKVYEGASLVTDIISSYPVNIFDFKETMDKYAQHLCYVNEEVLEFQNVSIDECITQHENNKAQCADKIFRLAPLNLQSKDIVLDYSQQYKHCALPYKYIVG
ncbi:hypothetical protein J8L70_03910 [Pseudoalteromonas sp. MMG010]|uniref:hypothetical protein n=1 Tax=Pseudoalteromonas sp. MMG010 TaxID=2822685 RepID=UPI001B3A75B3|nr:hypothetical protein [Pseudoalteromonas sp. MMG010]MBQ4832379.1 hypothetical protein [Pseudoalteromonas sp. MMG010]